MTDNIFTPEDIAAGNIPACPPYTMEDIAKGRIVVRPPEACSPEMYYFHVYMYLTCGVPRDEADLDEISRLADDCLEDGHSELGTTMKHYSIYGEE